MFGGLGNMMGLMKQAKEIKERMEKLQAELIAREYESQSGGGAVTARINGNGELLALKIQPDTLKSGDGELLEDLIRAAVNAAVRRKEETVREEMGRITAGLNLPGMGGLTPPG